MKTRKAVFFDIDGTLFEQGKKVPDSTVAAIHRIRENGHLAFVNSGRSRIMIPQTPILDIGFDGVIAACGMYGTYQGEILFHDEMSIEQMESVLPILKETSSMYILEGTEYIYFDEATIGNAQADWYIESIRAMIPGHFLPLPSSLEEVHACKISLQLPPDRAKEVIRQAEKYFEVLLHVDNIGEIVPRGFTKAEGILRVCERFGMDIKDTIAIGDSVNDVDMIKAAGTGIVMENGSPAAKECADYITTSLYENGIWNAMEHMGLL